MTINPPHQGFIFWPVGTGDSTTVRVAKTVYLQVDLRHMAKSEDDDDAAWPVIDELIEILPTTGDQPYLSVFALTHPDRDHCQGFEELNSRVLISELWMSPRTFREFREHDDLCDDAQAFHDEAMRRVNAAINAGGDPGRGDRIRIIGYDDLLQEPAFDGFPEELLSVPGHIVTTLDGEDLSDVFTAFVHAPFKDDSFGDRNDCSLAFQPGFPFCQPDQGLYTPTRLSARQISSSHVASLPVEAALDVEPTRAPAFRASLRHRSTPMLFLRQADFVALRPGVSRPAPVAPRSSAACRRTAAGSDALLPAGASSTAHASPGGLRFSPAAAEDS